MKRLILLFLLFSIPAWAQNPADWTSVGWLAGCWEGTGDSRIEEHWMAPAGSLMLGMSRTVRSGRPADYEFMRIAEEEGTLFFIAKPSGQPEARFRMVRAGEREVVFENPAHDFPQRILYRLLPDGTLAARIEGKINGKERSVDFPMKRASCAGESAVCSAE